MTEIPTTPRFLWCAHVVRRAAGCARLALLHLACFVGASVALEVHAPLAVAGDFAPPTDEDEPDLPREVPGLIARYAPNDQAAFTRIDAAPKLGKDLLPDPRISPGAFAVEFSGKLSVIAPRHARVACLRGGQGSPVARRSRINRTNGRRAAMDRHRPDRSGIRFPSALDSIHFGKRRCDVWLVLVGAAVRAGTDRGALFRT